MNRLRTIWVSVNVEGKVKVILCGTRDPIG